LQWKKNDLTTGAWQHNIECPISIVLLSTSDVLAITSRFRKKHANEQISVLVIRPITWSLAMVVANNEIDDKKCRKIAGNFDSHADAVVQCVAHHQMVHIQGFT
jgi:hypothetical protein